MNGHQVPSGALLAARRSRWQLDAYYQTDDALAEWLEDVRWLLADHEIDQVTREDAGCQEAVITAEQARRRRQGLGREQPGLGISRETLDELRRRVDLVALIKRSGVALRRSGRSYKGRCKWHDDRTPSLSVQPDRGCWHCFGCGLAGDGIDWLRAETGLDFVAAAAALAAEAGIPLRPEPITAAVVKTGIGRVTSPVQAQPRGRIVEPVEVRLAR